VLSQTCLYGLTWQIDYMRKQFGVSPGVPNVIVFDTTGQECYRIAGELNETQLSELAEVIENARREAKHK
jgi:hypothetical protein